MAGWSFLPFHLGKRTEENIHVLDGTAWGDVKRDMNTAAGKKSSNSLLFLSSNEGIEKGKNQEMKKKDFVDRFISYRKLPLETGDQE